MFKPLGILKGKTMFTNFVNSRGFFISFGDNSNKINWHVEAFPLSLWFLIREPVMQDTDKHSKQSWKLDDGRLVFADLKDLGEDFFQLTWEIYAEECNLSIKLRRQELETLFNNLVEYWTI